MANFKIGATEIKNPSGFKIEEYNITTLERLANGKMVGQLVAAKRKFYFNYDVILSTDLETILTAIRASLFFTLTYVENEVEKTAVVYAGSIPRDLHSAKTKIWRWKNLSFNLIEQ